MQRCERCKGYGMISNYSFGEMADLGQDCPDCGGDGFIETEDEKK